MALSSIRIPFECSPKKSFPGTAPLLVSSGAASNWSIRGCAPSCTATKIFGKVTQDAFSCACRYLQLSCTEQQRASLLDAYLRLETFPEVTAALHRLEGQRLAILSNGSPHMLRSVVESNGLSHVFELVLSVDALKLYKPHPSVYQHAVDGLGVPKESIGLSLLIFGISPEPLPLVFRLFG
jgi:2-haloalkanoic acid dehalogenase type II